MIFRIITRVKSITSILYPCKSLQFQSHTSSCQLCFFSIFVFHLVIVKFMHHSLTDIKDVHLAIYCLIEHQLNSLRVDSNEIFINKCLKFGFAASFNALFLSLTNLTFPQFLMFSLVFLKTEFGCFFELTSNFICEDHLL